MSIKKGPVTPQHTSVQVQKGIEKFGTQYYKQCGYTYKGLLITSGRSQCNNGKWEENYGNTCQTNYGSQQVVTSCTVGREESKKQQEGQLKSHNIENIVDSNRTQSSCDGNITARENRSQLCTNVQGEQRRGAREQSQHHTSLSLCNVTLQLQMLNGDYHMQNDINITWQVITSGKINAMGSKIPIHSNWNVRLFRALCTSDSDREVAMYLQYRWPLNRQEGPVTQTFFNHPSAVRYPQQIWKYLNKEKQMGTLLGPYLTSPFPEQSTGVSPMSTRPKKDSKTSRRVIVDLSWPPGGQSVNALILKDTYI